MTRRIREETVDDDVVVERRRPTRRIVEERRRGPGGPGAGFNPLGLVVAAALTVFIIVLVFGYLL